MGSRHRSVSDFGDTVLDPVFVNADNKRIEAVAPARNRRLQIPVRSPLDA